MKTEARLTVVIPVFNAERFIGNSVQELHAYLTSLYSSFEILVVDDGSSDGTAAILKQLSLPCVTVLRHPENRGKFAAIRSGMAQGCGECRIFLDADLPFDLHVIETMYRLITERRFHLVVGDRTLSASSFRQNSLVRRLCSQVFSAGVRLLVTGEIFDTQCGVKGFRGDIASELFHMAVIDGFAGDVEILYLARKFNLEIKRIPVVSRKQQPSSIRLHKAIPAMVADITKVLVLWKAGRYQSIRLESLSPLG